MERFPKHYERTAEIAGLLMRTRVAATPEVIINWVVAEIGRYPGQEQDAASALAEDRAVKNIMKWIGGVP